MNGGTKTGLGSLAVVLAMAGGTALGAHAAARGTVHRPPITTRAMAAADPQTTPEAHFVPLAPCRILDTKKANHPLKSGNVRNVAVAGATGFEGQGGHAGGCDVSTSAISVAVTFHVVSPSGSGTLRAWAHGATKPAGAVLSWPAHASLTNSASIAIADGAAPNLSVSLNGATANVTADVTGYYVPQIQADISSAGTIATGTSRVVDVVHTSGSGFYYVDLDRPARECSPTAVTYNTGHYASVGLSSSNTPNRISVYTWNVNSTGAQVLADESFFLTVTC